MTYSDRFLRAYNRYPHHEYRRKKKDAWKAWQTHNCEELFPSIMAHIKAVEARVEREGRQYIDGFGKWLRQTDFGEPAPRITSSKVICPNCHEEPCRCFAGASFGGRIMR